MDEPRDGKPHEGRVSSLDYLEVSSFLLRINVLLNKSDYKRLVSRTVFFLKERRAREPALLKDPRKQRSIRHRGIAPVSDARKTRSGEWQ